MGTTILAGVVALGMALGSAPAQASAPDVQTQEAATVAAADPSIALSRSLFERGLDAYENDDFAGAVKHWTAAYDFMDGLPVLLDARHVLAFDLGQAQVRAYDVDHDRTRLAVARELLEGYIAWVDRPEHTMSASEREDRARANEFLSRIAIESQPLPEPPPAPIPVVVVYPPKQPAQPGKKGTGLLVGGAVALAGSVAATGTALAMWARGQALEEEYVRLQEGHAGDPPSDEALLRVSENGQIANRIFIGSAVSAAVLGIAGVAMLATGGTRRRRYVSATATLAPTMAGAQLQVRF